MSIQDTVDDNETNPTGEGPAQSEFGELVTEESDVTSSLSSGTSNSICGEVFKRCRKRIRLPVDEVKRVIRTHVFCDVKFVPVDENCRDNLGLYILRKAKVTKRNYTRHEQLMIYRNVEVELLKLLTVALSECKSHTRDQLKLHWLMLIKQNMPGKILFRAGMF